MPGFAIVSPKSMRDDPAGWSTPLSSGASGTGPFVFRPGAWQPGQQIALERSAAYWMKDQGGTPLPYPDRVVFRVQRDETARISELRSGGLDAVRDPTPAALPTVKADPNLQLFTRLAASASHLGIATTAKPFDKVEIRRAIAMAIDKSLLAAALYSGAAGVAAARAGHARLRRQRRRVLSSRHRGRKATARGRGLSERVRHRALLPVHVARAESRSEAGRREHRRGPREDRHRGDGPHPGHRGIRDRRERVAPSAVAW